MPEGLRRGGNNRFRTRSQFPANARYRRELSNIYGWLGNASGGSEYFNLGDRQSALEYYRRAHQLTVTLASNDPKNRQALTDLRIAQMKMSDAFAASDPQRAIQYANECLDARVDTKLGSAALESGVRIQCLNTLANAEELAGCPARAIERRDEQQTLNDERLRLRPSDLGFLEMQVLILARRGSSRSALRQWPRAEADFAAALQAAERLSAQYPRDVFFLRDLADVCERVARFRFGWARAGIEKPENLRLAQQFAARAEKLWQTWPALAVSSAYHQTHLRRIAAFRGELERL